MKDLARRGATGLVVVGLALILLITPALAQSTATTTTGKTTTTTTNPSASRRSETCKALRKRLVGVPKVLTRIETNLDRLGTKIDKVRLAPRRTALEARVERLERLQAAINRKIADAERACGTV
jgi:hypothetical protein